MRDYIMDVTMRGDNQEGAEMPEWQITCTNLRAASELDARRQVLERAWGRGLLVSGFSNIKVRTNKRSES